MAREFIVKKRCKIKAISGDNLNLPFGTKCMGVIHKDKDGNDVEVITYNGKPICFSTSESAHDYFARNDDGEGEKRGHLIAKITNRLTRRDDNYQVRWNKIWDDKVICPQYRRTDQDDTFWLWNDEFFKAPVFDLEYIWNLIKEKQE